MRMLHAAATEGEGVVSVVLAPFYASLSFQLTCLHLCRKNKVCGAILSTKQLLTRLYCGFDHTETHGVNTDVTATGRACVMACLRARPVTFAPWGWWARSVRKLAWPALPVPGMVDATEMAHVSAMMALDFKVMPALIASPITTAKAVQLSATGTLHAAATDDATRMACVSAIKGSAASTATRASKTCMESTATFPASKLLTARATDRAVVRGSAYALRDMRVTHVSFVPSVPSIITA